MARKRKYAGTFVGAINSVVNNILSVTNEPVTLIFVVVALILYITRGDSDEFALIHALANAIKDIPALARLSEWIVANEHLVMGIIIMVPGALSVPSRYVTTSVLLSSLFVMFANKVSMYGFAMTSLSFRLFFRTTGLGRMLVMAMVLAMVIYSYSRGGKQPPAVTTEPPIGPANSAG